MPVPLLRIEGLSAGYHSRDVLRALSLEAFEGELIAVIGPNGHGKTTLLRTISGLVGLRSGSIKLAGRDIGGLAPHKIVEAGVIHVPQGDLLFPDLTVYENLLMGAYLPEPAARTGERMDLVFDLLPKLRECRNRTASTLSGGERRMCGIGRGLMGGGRLLMLDEPSLGLAPIVIEQIYALIESLKASGRTIVLVEENASRIVDMADRIYLLDNGRFVWTGYGGDLMKSPEILKTYLGA